MSTANEILTDDAKLLGWLSTNGVHIVTTFHIDRLGPGEVVRAPGPMFTCHNIDLAALKAGLAALIAPYQEHIDADHDQLQRVWRLHAPAHADAEVCSEDGFFMPCRTRRVMTQDAPQARKADLLDGDTP